MGAAASAALGAGLWQQVARALTENGARIARSCALHCMRRRGVRWCLPVRGDRSEAGWDPRGQKCCVRLALLRLGQPLPQALRAYLHPVPLDLQATAKARTLRVPVCALPVRRNIQVSIEMRA